MYHAIIEMARAATEQAQLGARPEATQLDPATEKKVLACNPVSEVKAAERYSSIEPELGDGGKTVLSRIRNALHSLAPPLIRKSNINLGDEFRLKFLIGVQTQNPISLRFVDRRILLRGVALPFSDEDFRAERFCDLDGAVGRAGIDDDDLTFAVGHAWLHASQRAPDVALFLVSVVDPTEHHA